MSVCSYSTMLACWEANPSDRPTFTNLVETMGELLQARVQQVRGHYTITPNVCTHLLIPPVHAFSSTGWEGLYSSGIFCDWRNWSLGGLQRKPTRSDKPEVKRKMWTANKSEPAH